MYYKGRAPTKCNTCPNVITDCFYDMRTSMGPWADMCPTCANLGPGTGRTGLGFGQKYEKQPDERWLKTAG